MWKTPFLQIHTILTFNKRIDTLITIIEVFLYTFKYGVHIIIQNLEIRRLTSVFSHTCQPDLGKITLIDSSDAISTLLNSQHILCCSQHSNVLSIFCQCKCCSFPSQKVQHYDARQLSIRTN